MQKCWASTGSERGNPWSGHVNNVLYLARLGTTENHFQGVRYHSYGVRSESLAGACKSQFNTDTPEFINMVG